MKKILKKKKGNLRKRGRLEEKEEWQEGIKGEK